MRRFLVFSIAIHGAAAVFIFLGPSKPKERVAVIDSWPSTATLVPSVPVHPPRSATTKQAEGDPAAPIAVAHAEGPAALALKDVVALGNRAPEYPREARDRDWEGDVELAMQTGKDGNVVSVSVVQGSGYRILDEAASEAAKRWRLPEGDESYRVRIEFRLH